MSSSLATYSSPTATVRHTIRSCTSGLQGISVYRCIRPEGLAAKAAEYAKRWTEKSIEGADWETINKKKEGDVPHECKTKYSITKKHLAEANTSDVEMTAKGVMKIAKAYASAADAGRVFALHPKNGVCCSQFIHYSFQAASIDLAVGGGSLRVPDAFRDKGVIRNSFRIKNFTPLYDGGPDIYTIWSEFIGTAPSKIIEPLRFDTSRTHVGRLWEILYKDANSEEPHFALIQGTGPNGTCRQRVVAIRQHDSRHRYENESGLIIDPTPLADIQAACRHREAELAVAGVSPALPATPVRLSEAECFAAALETMPASVRRFFEHEDPVPYRQSESSRDRREREARASFAGWSGG